MAGIGRRVFLLQMGAITAAYGLRNARVAAAADAPRRMTIDLVCGSLGVSATLPEAIQLARSHGFESVQPDAKCLVGLTSTQRRELADGLKAQGLVWGAAALNTEFRQDDATFQSGLKELPQQAAALQEVGCTRMGTWIKSSHPELTYVANFRQHAARLREVAKVLSDHEMRFGLEYVGPKTSWTAAKHPFVHTMAEMKELLAEINQKNMGLVLDSWHWYTAGESEADLLSLTNADVVACDLNDARQLV